MQQTSAQREQHPAAIRRTGRMHKAWLPGLLLLCATAIGQPIDPYGTTLDKHFGATNPTPDWNQMTGAQIKVVDFEDALKAQVRKMAQTPPQSADSPVTSEASGNETNLLLPVGMPSICLIAVALAGFCVKRKFDALALASEAEANRRLSVVLSDPALEAFFAALRNGLEGGAAVPAGAHDALPQGDAHTVTIKEFFSSVPDRFVKVRSLVSELGRSTKEDDRKKVLTELCEEVGSLKESSRFPALQPFWMLACALEGLLTQLLRETSELNASAQRTATAAIDLLQTLCVRDLNPNLATEPSVRILAVDDDAISRRAISFALKKVFEHSTLAPEGKTALDFTTRHIYDVIFLDVEMPGMDGFELCTRIRETGLNRTTPIVFVTRHSDFESRAKSSLSGGQDLIGKPYLSFEITVKALTLILGNRLRGRSTAGETKAAVEKAVAAGVVSAAKTVTPAAQPEVTDATKESAKKDNASRISAWRKTLSTTYTTTEGQEENSSADSRKLPDSFSAWSPDYLETLRSQLQAAMLCTVPDRLQELVTGLYVAVHSFTVESKRADCPTVHRLGTALEAMLKKLMEKPQFCTPSVWNAALAALDLLTDLSCRNGSDPGLAEPPPRILVVDDDPVARRAISGAVQLVFGKPDNAGDGETALSMASEKAFDLILLDVMMPGVDGFVTCSKIHQTRLNRETPIVFISNHDDAASREKAALSAGRGFIPKPVFSSQITLTALTSILRCRLEQSGPESVVSAQEELVSSLV
jgi:CheY-like chemotaxis protein